MVTKLRHDETFSTDTTLSSSRVSSINRRLRIFDEIRVIVKHQNQKPKKTKRNYIHSYTSCVSKKFARVRNSTIVITILKSFKRVKILYNFKKSHIIF